jgi:ferrochelatase
LSASTERRPSAADTAVLLVALGTPASPTPADVRRYLAEFLSDPRVVQLPRALWLPLLHCVVLRTRPRLSAQKYALIWTPEGSPLKVHTERQAKLLRGYLGERIKPPLPVAYAMRYGEPSLAQALGRLAESGVARVLVIPLYPQYTESTTASVADALDRYRTRSRSPLDLRMVRHFHDHPGYIRALAAQLRAHQEKNGLVERLLMSFHGLPQRAVDRGDPYRDECEQTARLLAREAGLREGQWQIAFQSRFGRARWLAPYTAATLEAWAREGMRRVDVICPGFTCDCLETLEEIGIEGRRTFLDAGGREFHLVPCLNERDEWIRTLADLAQKELDDWTARPARRTPG